MIPYPFFQERGQINFSTCVTIIFIAFEANCNLIELKKKNGRVTTLYLNHKYKNNDRIKNSVNNAQNKFIIVFFVLLALLFEE